MERADRGRAAARLLDGGRARARRRARRPVRVGPARWTVADGATQGAARERLNQEYAETVPGSSERRYGRGAFLLLLAGGGSSFFWASKASGVVTPFTSAFSQLLGNLFPVGGWRIYTISGSMPIFA